MEHHWIQTILAVCGVLFAIGGIVGAFLQVKWLRDQRRTLREILDALHAMRGNGFKGISNRVSAQMFKD